MFWRMTVIKIPIVTKRTILGNWNKKQTLLKISESFFISGFSYKKDHRFNLFYDASWVHEILETELTMMRNNVRRLSASVKGGKFKLNQVRLRIHLIWRLVMIRRIKKQDGKKMKKSF